MSNERKRCRRDKLWHQQNGLCYWCKVPCLKNYPRFEGRPIPPNVATLDHLDHAFSPERGQHAHVYRTVMACLKCNTERGIKAVEENLEEHKRRSNRLPRGASE